jgi:hypothetical protein
MELAFTVCCGFMLFIVGLVATILLTIFIDIVFDLDLHTFWVLDAVHFIVVFPVMLAFLTLRFKLQKRKECVFYFFEFSDIEANIIRKMGYDFECDDEEYSVQNVFGAKWERIDTTTTVFRRK